MRASRGLRAERWALSAARKVASRPASRVLRPLLDGHSVRSVGIQLFTFGGLRALDEAGQPGRLLAQHSRAALFIYLAVERRVSRESLVALFWPESDTENARHALRQSLYQLRKATGGDWIDSRVHELVVSEHVRVDAHDFSVALERGDVESAVRLYQGAFLDGVHLVDLKPWESWVESRRAQYARAYRKAYRDLLDARRAKGDSAGAIEIAERWAARDPADGEAQHRLIESLAAAGERAEAVRQYETYARMLEADGLEPLEETSALAERLRSEPAPLPALRTPAASEHAVSATAASSYHKDTNSTVADSPVAPSAAASPTRRRSWLVAAVALVVVLASFWALRTAGVGRAPASSPTTIAVLPFSVRGGEAVQYLGDGMVNLLGAALDGAGSLRPVDTRATFAAVAEAGDTVPDARHGGRIATRLGAGMFVLGDVVEAGGTLQIEATVYEDGASQPRSRAVVSGVTDSLFALVDGLAARLLGGLGDPAADRLLRTAALTTTSLPAFKSYLKGEALMRAGQFERAADDYLAAIALDSTFAVAHYRLALAREWAPLPGNEDAASAAARHSARLSARDRRLLEAFREWRSGNAAGAERAYREILARYPDDVDAWFQLGEIQFHHGPLMGSWLHESERAWRRVLSFEPQNLFALTHLARIAAVAGRAAQLDSLLRQFSFEQLRNDRRLEELLVLRAVARGDSLDAHARAQDVRRGESFSIWRVAVFLTAFAPDATLMRGVIEDFTKDYPNAGLRADLHWFASLLDLAGGRVNASRAALAEAAASERDVPADRRRAGFEAVTEWFAATLPLPYGDSTLLRARRSVATAGAASAASRLPFASELDLGTTVQLEPVRQYSLGILSLRLRDTASAAAAAAQLARLAASSEATALTRDLDRGLRARLAWQAGRAQEALRLLEALESRDIQGDIAATPFASRVNERFLRAEVLAGLGRRTEAIHWLWAIGDGSVTEVPLRAAARFRLAEIHESLGHRSFAEMYYAGFLRLWRGADAEFQPLVDSARKRLASLKQRD